MDLHPLTDWHQMLERRRRRAAVDPRLRIRGLCGAFLVLIGCVLGRLIALEFIDGDAFRAEQTRPIRRERLVPAARGRILSRDGTVLASDRTELALAVAYRRLQWPPDPRWLRSQARARLTPAERKQPERLEAEIGRVQTEQAEFHLRLAAVCGLSPDEWRRRTRRIEGRVQALSDRVNERRQERFESSKDASDDLRVAAAETGWLDVVGKSIIEALFAPDAAMPPPPVTVVEELSEHVVFGGLAPEAARQIESSPADYRGATIVRRERRFYPQGTLAAHVIGYVGRAPAEDEDEPVESTSRDSPEEVVGLAGVETQYEAWLHGESGLAVDELDRRGQVLSTTTIRAPLAGRDLVLTLDLGVQREAEALLDQALERRLPAAGQADIEPAGAAAVVLDVANGALLAAASAPRFDPNLFVGEQGTAVQSLLSADDHPLFDRVARMAIPPGSVFKTVSAAALLADRQFDPREPLECQGFLRSPDAMRCQVFRRHGIGHGPVTLADALIQSCNVYFFHHAEQCGPGPLVDWAERFGFGSATGVDLPGEASGNVPVPSGSDLGPAIWTTGETQLLAIGQSSLTATPLQVARMMAAVANGGLLVTPRVASDPGSSAPPRRIAGLERPTLDLVRDALRRVVADANGTGHATIHLESVAIVGKTGTAETGGPHDHAWFAGYAPAHAPQVAVVVAIEHAGGGGAAAGPVARRLVARMHELGWFDARDLRADRP